MERTQTPPTLIEREFSQLPLYFYKDKQLFKNKEFDALERRLRTRLSRMRLLFAVIIGLWLALSLYQFAEAAATPDTLTLILSLATIGLVTAWGVYMAHRYGHTAAKLDTVRHLLDEEADATPPSAEPVRHH